ncbi:TfpX/TfpZ family type IV pilin accessory protein [Acinetobacter kanungonis]|uniref:TfpX/TfpZ family type IV pilin accessory protein n=1 Tax=Acinetobacter kanungonis TaxID=2699469 RepID=UPI0013794880|nr:TfpX/TfpZ family type IV pilin accessory protein [Acinetobacter kanungonis]NCI78003.1 type IV pilin accessory protein [Acinetobacter kanungonis]
MSKRLSFFLRHLGISALVGLFTMFIIFYIWYPAPLAKAVGVTYIFLMLIIVDILVGPILGLIVYKKGKKSLKFDLMVIVLIQFSALSYGIYSIAQGRPVWLVYAVDRFEVVRNNEIFDKNIQQAQIQFQNPSWFKPEYVAVQFAKDSKQRSEDMFAEIFSGIALSQHPELYVPINQARSQIQQRSLSLNLLDKFNAKGRVKEVLEKYPQANAYLPLKANAVDMTVLINKDTTQIIKIVDLRPWK